MRGLSEKDMKELNVTELYGFFTATLSHLGICLLTCDREEIAYRIFEEFDSDCTSFLHQSNLRVLLEGGLISFEIYEASLRLVAEFRALEGTALWNPDAVTAAEAWRKVLELGDTVRGMVEAHESFRGRTDV